MSITLVILALAQPLPSSPASAEDHPANGPAPAFQQVDLIVINQHYSSARQHDGSSTPAVRYYVSFWSLHEFPTGSFLRLPVWEHRGWSRNQPPLKCEGGWGCQVDDTLIIAPRVVFIASDYDFEYRNRYYSWGRKVTR